MNNKIADATILVTGGAGFVGSYVIEELLLHQPKKIRIIDNLIRGSYYNMQSYIDNPVVEFIEGDVRDAVFRECIIGCDYVFIGSVALMLRANQQDGFDVCRHFYVAEFCKTQLKSDFSSSARFGLAQNFPTPETDNPYNNQTFYGAAKMWGTIFRSIIYANGLCGLRILCVW